MESLAVRQPDPTFWRGRRVLLTGHTGFKGAWLALMLTELGAEVVGIALPPEPGPSLFSLLRPGLRLTHHEADIRDAATLVSLLHAANASIILHLAAQSLVTRGFADPAGTFAANLTGTVNLLEAMRGRAEIEAALVVTTDKVYRNLADGRRFREHDPLGGHDPYSASKAAAELAVSAWRASFHDDLPELATARAGNVIGGGDFAPTRLVPDIVRARTGAAPLVLRHPDATRPWQHVLDVLRGYLLQAEYLAQGGESAPALNFGPAERDSTAVRDVIAAFETAFGAPLPWRHEPAPAEAPRLALDPSLAGRMLRWRPRLDRAACIEASAAWYAAWARGEDMLARSRRDVREALA
jgi:CDP-glucose 4,6-dehydratase